MIEAYDGILVHGYTDQAGHSGDFGDRNEMQATAAEALYKAGYARNIVLAGGHYWGSDKPAFAQAMTDRLVERGVNPDDIITRPDTTTTVGEIDVFLEEAQRNEWGRLMSLSTRTHTPRIALDYFKKGRRDVEQMRAERVLFNIEENGQHPHRDFLRRFRGTETLFKIREAVALTADLYGLQRLGQRISDSTLGQQIKAKLDK